MLALDGISDTSSITLNQTRQKAEFWSVAALSGIHSLTLTKEVSAGWRSLARPELPKVGPSETRGRAGKPTFQAGETADFRNRNVDRLSVLLRTSHPYRLVTADAERA